MVFWDSIEAIQWLCWSTFRMHPWSSVWMKTSKPTSSPGTLRILTCGTSSALELREDWLAWWQTPWTWWRLDCKPRQSNLAARDSAASGIIQTIKMAQTKITTQDQNPFLAMTLIPSSTDTSSKLSSKFIEQRESLCFQRESFQGWALMSLPLHFPGEPMRYSSLCW